MMMACEITGRLGRKKGPLFHDLANAAKDSSTMLKVTNLFLGIFHESPPKP